MRFRFFTFAAAFLLASSSVEAQPSEPVTRSAAPGMLTAEAIAEAQARFRRALELHDEGNLDASRMELRRAYEIAPNYKVLFNLAQVEFELHDYAAAMTTFEKYLTEGGDRIPKERRTQVQHDIEKLRGRVGSLEVAVNVPGAQVKVDEVTVGTSPLIHPLMLNAGRRRITVIHPTLGSDSRLIDVAGGDHGAMSFELVEAPSVAPPPASAAAEPPPPPPLVETPATSADKASTRSSVPWAGWVTTAVLAAGAGVTGALALQRSQQLSTERGRLGAGRSELDRLQKEATAFAVTSDICAGSAAFAGVLSLYLTLSSSGTNKGEQGRAVRVAPGLGFVSVEGSF